MSEMGELWREVAEARKQKRAGNRESSADLLRKAGLSFVDKNLGAHLIVSGKGHTIDFWPGTGLWIMRGSTQRHYGVRKLIALLK